MEKSIEKNSLASLLSVVLDMAIPVLLSVYTAGILRAEGAGRVAYAQNIAGCFSAFAESGVMVYGMREIAQCRQAQGEKNRVFTGIFLMNAIITTGVLIAYLMVMILADGIKEQMLLFFACGLPILFNYLNVDWFFQGEEEYVYIAARNLMARMLSLTAVFAFVRTWKDYVVYAFIMSLTKGYGCISGAVRVRSHVRLVKERQTIRRHVRPLMTVTLSLFLMNFYNRISITMLGALSTKAETGYYSYACTAVRTITGVCTSAVAVFSPRLSCYYREDKEKFYELFQLGLEMTFLLAIPVWAGVFILAPQIVTVLYGTAFLPVSRMLRILSMLILVWSISDLSGYQMLLITGNETMSISVSFFVLTATVLADRLLIPVLSGDGAAMIFLAGNMILNGCLMYKVHGLISCRMPYKILGQILISTAVMGSMICGLIRMMDAPAAQCAAGILAGVVVYGIMNLVLKNECILFLADRLRKERK